MQNSIQKRWHGEDESNYRAGRADIEKSAIGSNGGTYEDNCPKCADDRGKRNKNGVTGTYAMMAASEEMTEFMREKYCEDGECKRESGSERRRMSIDEREVVEEFVHGGGPVMGERNGEMRAGDEAGDHREKEKKNGQHKRFI